MNKVWGEIIDYIRDAKMFPIACMIARGSGDDVLFGWSKCRKDEKPKNKELGKKIAIGRLDSEVYFNEIPHCIREEYPKFIKRCNKYFQVPIDGFHNVNYEG